MNNYRGADSLELLLTEWRADIEHEPLSDGLGIDAILRRWAQIQGRAEHRPGAVA